MCSKTLGERRLTLDVRFIGEMETWMLEVLGGEVAKCQVYIILHSHNFKLLGLNYCTQHQLLRPPHKYQSQLSVSISELRDP